jgi:hypothetical protein
MKTQVMARVATKPELQRCMNPPRVHFARREHKSAVERKTVSVDARLRSFKVASFQRRGQGTAASEFEGLNLKA